jgi:hypothetical protein
MNPRILSHQKNHQFEDLCRLAGFPHSSREIAIRPKNQNDPNGYYDFLGLDPSATTKEIREAYYAMARYVHPDGSNPNKEKFEMLSQIYETLTDPNKKLQYEMTEEGHAYVGNIEMHELRERYGANIAEITEEKLDNPTHFSYYGSKQDNDLAQEWYEILGAAMWALDIKSPIKLCLFSGREPHILPGVIVIPNHLSPNYFIALRLVNRLKSI